MVPGPCDCLHAEGPGRPGVPLRYCRMGPRASGPMRSGSANAFRRRATGRSIGLARARVRVGVDEPLHRQHLLDLVMFEMRPKDGVEGELELLVLELALLGAARGDLVHLADEQTLVVAVGGADQVEVALLRRPVVAREGRERQGDLRLCAEVLDVGVVAVGGAVDQLERLLAAELKHDKGRELIGGVLLAPEHRDVEDVEHGMAELVRDGEEQLAAYCVLDGDAHHRLRLLGHALPDFLQIFVADAHGRHVVDALIPGIGDAVAADSPDVQIDITQDERAENLAHHLERMALHDRVVDSRMRGFSSICSISPDAISASRGPNGRWRSMSRGPEMRWQSWFGLGGAYAPWSRTA